MLQIRTNYGNTYKVDDDGYVIEYSNGLKEDPNSESRKTWQITGAWYNIGFGHYRIITLSELLTKKDFRLKNGEPRYGLTDIDHGTTRLHGNKRAHGVSAVWAC